LNVNDSNNKTKHEAAKAGILKNICKNILKYIFYYNGSTKFLFEAPALLNEQK
jgi:hypothetical protein